MFYAVSWAEGHPDPIVTLEPGPTSTYAVSTECMGLLLVLALDSEKGPSTRRLG